MIGPCQPAGTVCMVNGLGSIVLRPQAGAGSGVAYAAINLDMAGGTAPNTMKTCLPSVPAPSTAGAAARPWMRAPNGICTVVAPDPATRASDPVGRATFGMQAPEVKRVIHVREVFN